MVFPAGADKTGKIIAAVEPFVRAAVLSHYNVDVSKPTVCPGESNCDKWASAKGKSHAAKERNACRNCALFSTKTERYKQSHEGLTSLVGIAQYAKRRKDSGYPMPLEQITNLTLETMLMLDEVEAQQERKMKLEHRMILMAGFSLKEQ